MLNPHVHDSDIHEGSQSLLYIATDEHDPLQAFGKTNYEHKGLSIDPYINTNS